MKKIRLYINKEYICTSTSYKTCREFKNSVEEAILSQTRAQDSGFIAPMAQVWVKHGVWTMLWNG